MTCTREFPLICVIGKSGAGKTSTTNNTLLSEVVSYATRKMRDDEIEGNPYYFIDDLDFHHMCKKGEFAEYRKVYDHYKGVSWDEINNKDVFTITPEGVDELKVLGIPVCVVYISGEPFESRNRDEYDFSNVEFDYEIANSLPLSERSQMLVDIYEEIHSNNRK